jgi:hypothetical protein
MMEQISNPSERAEESRSKVTPPPIRLPGIHDGSGTIGNRKISVPGIGTPIVIPINVRNAKIHSESFNVQSKLLAQGASSRNE